MDVQQAVEAQLYLGDRIIAVEGGCWLWRGSVGSLGYPLVRIDGKVMSAATAIWQHTFNMLNHVEYHLRRRCSEKLCVNPKHLEALLRMEHFSLQKIVVDPRVTIGESGCWLWGGALSVAGYALSTLHGKQEYVHRISYLEAKRSSLDPTLELDHLCRNRNCINPNHLEEVTHAENVRRGLAGPKAMCIRGHELIPENLDRSTRGRKCKLCRRLYVQEHRAEINERKRLRRAQKRGALWSSY